jgi:hypothetical protein
MSAAHIGAMMIDRIAATFTLLRVGLEDRYRRRVTEEDREAGANHTTDVLIWVVGTFVVAGMAYAFWKGWAQNLWAQLVTFQP